ncbi:ATP-dependent RNA helicase DEAH13-like [Bidens hawaiensis]|uniref:ATP-dependent RNA helicase DEAH13-like n=1 Tax=Bidens hawaiensis TaxID=980011 RepID=UPI004049A4BA
MDPNPVTLSKSYSGSSAKDCRGGWPASFIIIPGNTDATKIESQPNSTNLSFCIKDLRLLPDNNSNQQPTADGSPGALTVLPSYAMLPASAQFRLFEEIKEGEQLLVVATNVAETPTIPGIKYVVVRSREKVKNYNSSNGMETYEVQWISKGSAAQRAGRAGRTGPGHCYRLYSSAVFNNIFEEFSTAEILKTPVDGVVLLMKSMGIKEVLKFPFPTPPEAKALHEAELCLKSLEALDYDGNLTPLGKSMSHYPMSPRHSRMVITVIQLLNTGNGPARRNLILAYAVASAAALSLSNAFI